MNQNSNSVTKLLNGTLSSIKTVVPINYQMEKPRILYEEFFLSFGVLVGITGDIKGKLVFTGDPTIFEAIGEKMYGMSLEGEMLLSFSGELGNMIAGGMSTKIAESGMDIDITTPTILQGETTLSGYKQALAIAANFENIGFMNTNLLLD
ncbi:chemotaxis protein CheX [Pseudogracilibacillus auburnensis]|uniref:Chemotaxis protein CheX n=1 Tax=Pseudogracilibacillus auburnensis TaxID=1494959 RepID=A0A2V3W0N5_9BACI|nr:chemotaxis protein CheX [Pseudogracilibacillus auburnensis]PXW82319.1 chemotaxis protein CheX [Pseudogracilibacillus auburnensis]